MFANDVAVAFEPSRSAEIAIPGDDDTNEYAYSTSKLSEVDALKGRAADEISTRSIIGPNFVQTPLEKSTFTFIRDQRERSRVTLRSFSGGSGSTQHISTSSMEQVVGVKVS